MIEAVGCQILDHRSVYKQSHGRHQSGSLAIKINGVEEWALITGEQSTQTYSEDI